MKVPFLRNYLKRLWKDDDAPVLFHEEYEFLEEQIESIVRKYIFWTCLAIIICQSLISLITNL